MTPEEQLLVEAVKRGLIDPSKMAAAPAQQQTGTPGGYIKKVDPRGMTSYELIGTPAAPTKGRGLMSLVPASVTQEGKLQWDTPPALDAVVNAFRPGPTSSMATPGQPLNETDLNMTTLASLGLPVNPGVRAGDLAIPGMKTSLGATTATVAALGKQQFKNLKKMPVDFDVDKVRNLGFDIEAALKQEGLPPHIFAPKIKQILGEIQGIPDEAIAVSANDIIVIRKALQRAATSAARTLRTGEGSGEQYAAASSAIKALDEFISRAADEGSATGPVGEFVTKYGEARANIAASKRAGMVAKSQSKSIRQAARANSGQNVGNTLRANLERIRDKEDLLRGWTPEEVAALDKIITGGRTMNAMRTASNMAGGGRGAVMTGLAGTGGYMGASVGGPVGAAVGAGIPLMVGGGTRALYNRMVNKAIDSLEQKLLERAPGYEAAGTVADNPRALTNLLRGLLVTQTQPKVPAVDELYLSAKKQRDELNAANEKMRRGIR